MCTDEETASLQSTKDKRKPDIPFVFLGVYVLAARQDVPARAPGHCQPLHTCSTVRKELGA